MDVTGYWRYSRGYVGGFISGLRQPVPPTAPVFAGPDLENPEILLDLAQQEMKENQAKNRERTVMAITQKNNLQAEVHRMRRTIDNLLLKADLARSAGDAGLEQQLQAESIAYRETLAGMELSLQSAQETIETIKVAMRREEERIRSKTAQAMALKTQWKQSQIAAALDLTVDAETETVIKPLRYETQALVVQAHRLSGELWTQAERALRNGNRALARAILTERAAFQNAFADPA